MLSYLCLHGLVTECHCHFLTVHVVTMCLQERGGTNFYNHGNLTLKFKMDNELEIIFVVRGGEI